MREERPVVLSDLICGVNRKLEQAIEAQLKPNGLSIEHYRVLKALDAANGMAMGDLAARVFVDSPTLTKIIDKMVAAANVYRGPDPRDRRRVLVFISKKGSESLERVGAGASLAEVDILGKLGSERIDALMAILTQLLAEPEVGATSEAAPAGIASGGIELSLR